MPGCLGSGVGVALAWPDRSSSPMQAYELACSEPHDVPPVPRFHRTKFSVEIGPLKKATPLHVSPGLTQTNLLQLVTMPGCTGAGVGSALVCPGCSDTPTHT